LDLFFGLSLAALLFGKEAGQQGRGAAFGVKTSGLEIQRVLAVHEAGEAVRAFAHFNVAGALQEIHSGFAGDLRRSGAFGKFDALLARQRKIISGFGLVLCKSEEMDYEKKADEQKGAHKYLQAGFHPGKPRTCLNRRRDFYCVSNAGEKKFRWVFLHQTLTSNYDVTAMLRAHL